MENNDQRANLKASYLVDPQTDLVENHFAVIPRSKRARNRFPENVVQLHPSLEQAIAAADPANNRYPAEVYGPSRSSEGFRLYYLVRWIE
jgi:hypothetical protein